MIYSPHTLFIPLVGLVLLFILLLPALIALIAGAYFAVVEKRLSHFVPFLSHLGVVVLVLLGVYLTWFNFFPWLMYGALIYAPLAQHWVLNWLRARTKLFLLPCDDVRTVATEGDT
ncbi:MAG: hypothetical protein NDI91_11095 [Sulfuritalea sp.]|nr:hypothetical protein [Sulfuritalea sp.]